MALALRSFGVFDNIQMMPFAYFVRQVNKLLPRTFLDLALIHIGLESSAVFSIHIIEDNVQMCMVGIGMDCEKVLVFALEEFFAKFLAYFQSSFRRDLTRLKALNKVLREDSIQARSSCTDCFKISACLCRIRAAPVCEDQSAAVCFFRVGDIG